MQLITREISVPSPRTEVKIVGLSCIHYGAAGCDEDLAEFWRQRILNSPNTYAILLGDLVDAISEKDKRYDEQEIAAWCKDNKWGGTLIDRQYAYFLAKWLPLAQAGKVLWLHAGNHEQKLRSTHNTDLAARWAGEMGVPYAGLAALSNVFVRSPGGRSGRGYRVSFFSQHGGGGAQSTGAIINKADAMLSHYDVDVALMGHLHRKMHVTSRTLGITESGKRKVRDRVAAVCGTFLDGQKEGVVGYGELKGYRPAALGPVVVHLKYEGTHAERRPDDKRATGYLRIWLSDAIRDEEA